MKKTLVSVLTTALVVGAVSTTFAAANPFSDVPTDHWAYDAVSTLAADGVIEGYGDRSFKGSEKVTRYEMAQMIAKAMAKTNVSGNDKALLDKLAAEFADELNNLGVRVANLERNADKVKFTGEARYRYWSRRNEQTNGSKTKSNTDSLQYRLFPTAEINDNWNVNARLTGSTNLSKDKDTSSSNGSVQLSYIYADGQYHNFEVKAGKLPLYSTADAGLVMDDFFSGAQLTFGNKLKATLEAGRWNLGDANDGIGNSRYQKNPDGTVYKVADVAQRVAGLNDDAASYQGLDLGYTLGKLNLGTAYRQFSSDVFKNVHNYHDGSTTDKAQIWSLGGQYTFDKNVALAGSYAKNAKADSYNKSGNIELDYKGADKKNKGSWGAFVAYRHLGQNVSLMPTYDTIRSANNEKGWDFSASYIPYTNVLTTLGYFTGKELATDKDAETLYARVSLFF